MALTVLDLLKLDFKEQEALDLVCIGGRAGLTAEILAPELNRPGLALGGFFENFAHQRIQLFGRGETAYLRKMQDEGETDALVRYFSFPIPCTVVTHDQTPTDTFMQLAEEAGHAVLRTDLGTSDFINRVVRTLAVVFAPTEKAHGVMVEVFGLGVLIQGPSGVGKSEAALALIERGHRIVADDLVEIRRVSGNVLNGRGAGASSFHMEVRGLGIINITHLFGAGAVLGNKNIQLVCHLEEWEATGDYDRLGDEAGTAEFLGVHVPEILIPVRPGRNIDILIETAARNERLKHMGYSATEDFKRDLWAWSASRQQQPVTIEEW